MPRSVQDILDHADELARRFEAYEPAAEDERDAQVFAALRDAARSRSDAERSIRNAVDDARTHGFSWAFIGTLLGTSGEAARDNRQLKCDVAGKPEHRADRDRGHQHLACRTRVSREPADEAADAGQHRPDERDHETQEAHEIGDARKPAPRKQTR